MASIMYCTAIHVQYICWAELFLASYLVPNASFLGHLCGIVVGWLHVRYVEPKLRGLGQQVRDRAGRWGCGLYDLDCFLCHP